MIPQAFFLDCMWPGIIVKFLHNSQENQRAQIMDTIRIRNVIIGEGIPKICIPVTGITAEEISSQARDAVSAEADIVEWRADWFEGVFDFTEVDAVLCHLRSILGDTPLLMTFRSSEEGGEKDIDNDQYAELNIRAAASGLVDLIDIEVFSCAISPGSHRDRLIEDIHAHGVRVVGSYHDFCATPSKEEIVRKMIKIQDTGADIIKIAVMPHSKADVLTLLEAANEMVTVYAERPVIAVSMGSLGSVSRIAGEVFGSAVTFGTAGKSSAPGQIDAGELRTAMEILHRAD